jgi:hypothetical protein
MSLSERSEGVHLRRVVPERKLVARNHYEQTYRAFDRGDWEAANAQLGRTGRTRVCRTRPTLSSAVTCNCSDRIRRRDRSAQCHLS